MDVLTAWFEFYNRLTDALKKEFPDLKLATIAYQGYRDVPQCLVRNSEFVEYASHSRCNIHLYGQPGCRHNEQTMQAMLAWQATGYVADRQLRLRVRHLFQELPFRSVPKHDCRRGPDQPGKPAPRCDDTRGFVFLK